MRREDRDRRLHAIVEREKTGRLQLPDGVRPLRFTSHSRVDSRDKPHPGGQHEQSVNEADRAAEPPGRPAPGVEGRHIDECEDPAIHKV